MIGKLDAHEIDQLLARQTVGRIGMHADGITYVVPVSYAYQDPYVYVHTREGMKVNMMRKNPKVCFEIDDLLNMANWKSVIAWGDFEELSDKSDREVALRCLVDRILPLVSSQTTHLSPQWPFPPKDLNEIKGVVFRIKLTEKSGRFEQSAQHKTAAS